MLYLMRAKDMENRIARTSLKALRVKERYTNQNYSAPILINSTLIRSACEQSRACTTMSNNQSFDFTQQQRRKDASRWRAKHMNVYNSYYTFCIRIDANMCDYSEVCRLEVRETSRRLGCWFCGCTVLTMRWCLRSAMESIYKRIRCADADSAKHRSRGVVWIAIFEMYGIMGHGNSSTR